jgi:hypothetical protein
MHNWEKEFLPWPASLPEEDRLEVADLFLQVMAAAMDQKFHSRVSHPAAPVPASTSQPGRD